jgi:hypothetical protein
MSEDKDKVMQFYKVCFSPTDNIHVERSQKKDGWKRQ